MPSFCYAETFTVIVCYSYGANEEEALKLPHVQNLCDYDTPHHITCNTIFEQGAPMAFNKQESTYTVIYGET